MSNRTRPVVMFIGAALMVAGAYLAPTSAQQAARVAPDVYNRLHWRFIGPEGNRSDAAAGVPGDPDTYYVGSASGGIFKTTDGGVHWAPIFDDQPVASIGSLAVAASDPNIVWAGTGEGFIRSHVTWLCIEESPTPLRPLSNRV